MFKMILSAVVALGLGSVAYATGTGHGATTTPTETTKTDTPATTTDAATTGETRCAWVQPVADLSHRVAPAQNR